MANPGHVKVAREGVAAVAGWRESHPGSVLDLRGAHLTGVNLASANLSDAVLAEAELSDVDLSGANLAFAKLLSIRLTRGKLTRADLTGAMAIGADLLSADLANADLHGADFMGAKLVGAKLTSADLTSANLMGADLLDANLTGANLLTANFVGASLRGANLAQARCGATVFGGVDLSRCQGLEAVQHVGPSIIGVDTLLRTAMSSGGTFSPLGRTFLLSAGVPAEVLDAIPALVKKVRYYSCFIAYGGPDKVFATKLYDDLKSRGVSCWLFDADAAPGRPVWGEIGKHRREADKVVVTCSAASLVRDGLQKEIEETVDGDPSKLLPISLDAIWQERGFVVRRGDRDLKPYLVQQVYADFQGWGVDPGKYSRQLERLLSKGLSREAG
jgi:hypothetical protein